MVDKPVVKSVPAAKPLPKVATPAPKVTTPAATAVADKPVIASAMPTPKTVPPVAPKAEAAIPSVPFIATPLEQNIPQPVMTPAAETPMAPAIEKGTRNMNETFTKIEDTTKNFAAEATTRANAAFGDMNVRAKEAMAKGSKAMEDAVEFSKGNLEAVVASTRIAAKGAQDIAKYSAEYGRKTIEGANETAKKFAAVKSPTEFFQLQSEVAKSNLDAVVAEASKFTESYLKLLGEIVQPMQSRYAVAVEKAKSAVAA